MEELAETIRNPTTKLQEWDQPNTYSVVVVAVVLVVVVVVVVVVVRKLVASGW